MSADRPTNQQATIKLLSAIAIFAVGFGLGSNLKNCSGATDGLNNGIRTERTVTKDTVTVVKVIHHEPSVIYMTRGESRPQDSNDMAAAGNPQATDSCVPFVASKTAVFDKDTVKSSLYWPQGLWNIELRRGPDSVLTNTITIKDSSTTYVPVPDTDRWGVALFAGYAWGVNDLNSNLLAPANIRVGVGFTFNLVKW